MFAADVVQIALVVVFVVVVAVAPGNSLSDFVGLGAFVVVIFVVLEVRQLGCFAVALLEFFVSWIASVDVGKVNFVGAHFLILFLHVPFAHSSFLGLAVYLLRRLYDPANF